MALAELNDVQRLIPSVELSSDDMSLIEGLIEEAGDIVEAYCRRSFDDPPDAVRRVVARIAARAYTQETLGGDVPSGATSMSYSAGPFQRSFGFESGTTSRGAWLSAADKQRLARWRGGAFTIWPY